MNTDEIMQIALKMAGLDEIPGDTGIHVPGENIKKILIFIATPPYNCITFENAGRIILITQRKVYKAQDMKHR